MKIKLLILSMIFVSLLISCDNKEKEEPEVEKEQTEKQENLEPQQYVITVKQGDEVFGDIVFETMPDVAPNTCKHVGGLIEEGFYDGTAFHRVIPGFMIQGGDPNSKDKPRELWGMGDPNQKNINAEFSDVSHKRGIVSMARAQDPNSASSQFFICVADSEFLDGNYTVFGKVIEGMEVADKVVNVPRDKRDNPNEKVEMTIKKK